MFKSLCFDCETVKQWTYKSGALGNGTYQDTWKNFGSRTLTVDFDHQKKRLGKEPYYTSGLEGSA